MPLNEREQRILEEIERQFYEEDPKLAETVAKTTLESIGRRWHRLAIVGLIVGFAAMIGFLSRSTIAALGGFVLMLVSAGYLTMNYRRSRGGGRAAIDSWLDRARQRWRRDG